MTVKLDYARTDATRPRLSWPRRIFPGLAGGVATAVAWIGGVGEWLDGPLGNMVGWWVAPVAVLVLLSAVYALCYRQSLMRDALWSALIFSLIGCYGLALLGLALLRIAGGPC